MCCGVSLIRAGVIGVTERCLFCGKKHLHGIGEGHRVAHCVDSVELTLPDGRKISNRDGYILKKG